MSDVRIEYMPLESLRRWPRNPKEHDLGAIHESIRRFGFVAPILIDEWSERIVAGHGRLEALCQIRQSGEPAPERIHAEENDWLVPVIRGIRFTSDREAEAYLIADNRLTIMGGWNAADLAGVLADLGNLEGTGYDAEDLESLSRKLETETSGSGSASPNPIAFVVECDTAEECERLIDRFSAEGLRVRPYLGG